MVRAMKSERKTKEPRSQKAMQKSTRSSSSPTTSPPFTAMYDVRLCALSLPTTPHLTQAATPAFMYVRIKRDRACIFLKCEPGETVASLKSRVEALTQTPAAEQRLLGEDGSILEDASSLSTAGVTDGACLGLCHRLPDGSWEALHIEAYDYGGEG